VFSQADYELASRVLGLPVPRTAAEMAAAAPAVARVVREFGRGTPPMPGHDTDGMYTGATRSLNGYPDNNQPMQKAALASRLRVERDEPETDEYLIELMSQLDDEEFALVMQLLAKLADQGEEEMDRLSSQRPLEYDTPNLGSNYSVLNAPSSSSIPPSQEYQALG